MACRLTIQPHGSSWLALTTPACPPHLPLATQADTVTLLQAIVAEGDADHLPSHVRSYRIAKMVQQVM
jgi:hypothetical protein